MNISIDTNHQIATVGVGKMTTAEELQDVVFSKTIKITAR